MSESWSFETKQVHAGATPDPTTGARATPIYQTTSYTFRDTQHAADLFGLAELGQHLHADHEPDAGRARAARRRARGRRRRASRSPAARPPRRSRILNIAEAGDHFVSSASLYGGTYNLFHYTLPKLGIEVTFVDDPDDLERVARRDPAEHQAVLRRDARQPARQRARRPRGRRRRARGRRAADRRQHRADAVPAAPDRARRRHRRPLGDQVPRRARHHDRRRRRRRRHLRLRASTPTASPASPSPTRATTA